MHFKNFINKTKPHGLMLSLSNVLAIKGKSSTKQSNKRKRPLVSDSEIREHKEWIRQKAANKEVLDADRARGLFGYCAEVNNKEDRLVANIQRNQPVHRVFAESVRPALEEDIRTNRLEWNNCQKRPHSFRILGKGFGWYDTRKIVLAEPNPETNPSLLYPDNEGEGFGSWNPNQDQPNILRIEVKLTRDMYRAFARLQESEGFVPGLIDTKEVLYKEDFRALFACLGAYPTDELMNNAFARADTMNKGWISYRRFLKAKEWILEQGHDSFDYHNLFDMLDRNKDGTLCFQELDGLSTASGHVLTPEETEMYFNELGKTPEEGLTKEEFVKLLSRRQDLAWILRTGYRVVFVLGPPASGKGTYCEALKKRLNINHVSTGDLLREEVAAKTTLGKRVEQIMKRGELVDSSTATVLLQKYLRLNSGKHVFVDGFPRSMQNSTDFLSLCGRPEFAMLFDAPDEVLLERLRKRAISLGREDDKDEKIIIKRLKVFREANENIVKNLRDNGVDVFIIDATCPVDENVEKIVYLMKTVKAVKR